MSYPEFWISVLIVGEAITFLLATLLHLGVPLPLGISEPRIIPAAIVEGLCGLFLAVSAYAVLTHKTWAWWVAIAAHTFAVAGGLLGGTPPALGPGPRTQEHTPYHAAKLGGTVLSAALLIETRA